jgi:hypothetical protein
MSDYRDPNDPTNDPTYGNLGYEPADRRAGSGWGWIAGAVFLVIILALAFGLGHEPSRLASNDSSQSPATHTAPPANTINPAPPGAPGLTPPPAPAPAPNRP